MTEGGEQSVEPDQKLHQQQLITDHHSNASHHLIVNFQNELHVQPSSAASRARKHVSDVLRDVKRLLDDAIECVFSITPQLNMQLLTLLRN